MSRLSSLPVSLPPVSAPGNVVVSSDLAAEIVKKIQSLNEDSFVPDGVWRDSCAVTGTLRTFYGAASITRAWKDCLSLSKAINFQAAPVPPEEIRLPGGAFWVEVALNFETENTYSTALVSIIPDSTPANQGQAWKIWVLRTIVQQIKNAPRIDVYNPSVSNAHTEVAVSNNTSPRTSNQFTFDCVIVGAGQAGLDAAARCAAQQISYVVLDKEPRVGDSWRSRYDSARLHTTRDYTHLPYDRTFDESFPEYLGKDDLADAYEKYAQKMHLNVWLSSRLRSGHWNKTQQQWNLHVETDSEFREVVSKFVIMAIGPGGQIPVVPVFPGRERFQGVVLHSEEYKSPKGFAGRKGVVVGSANTAHDIVNDMLDEGLDSVTMVQRSKTYVLPQEWFIQTQNKFYNKVLPTDLGDMLSFTYPNAVYRLIGQATFHGFARMFPSHFEGLQKAGFRVDVFGDPVYHLVERLGGHYIDVGVSAKIADGKIKMKSDAAVTHYTPNGLGFSDGSELSADLIVFSTGFDINMTNQIRELFGDEVARHFGDFTAMDEEGEASGAYKFFHPGLACVGGAIGVVRWYTRLLVLTMKASLMGKPLKLYQGEKKEKEN